MRGLPQRSGGRRRRRPSSDAGAAPTTPAAATPATSGSRGGCLKWMLGSAIILVLLFFTVPRFFTPGGPPPGETALERSVREEEEREVREKEEEVERLRRKKVLRDRRRAAEEEAAALTADDPTADPPPPPAPELDPGEVDKVIEEIWAPLNGTWERYFADRIPPYTTTAREGMELLPVSGAFGRGTITVTPDKDEDQLGISKHVTVVDSSGNSHQLGKIDFVDQPVFFLKTRRETFLRAVKPLGPTTCQVAVAMTIPKHGQALHLGLHFGRPHTRPRGLDSEGKPIARIVHGPQLPRLIAETAVTWKCQFTYLLPTEDALDGKNERPSGYLVGSDAIDDKDPLKDKDHRWAGLPVNPRSRIVRTPPIIYLYRWTQDGKEEQLLTWELKDHGWQLTLARVVADLRAHGKTVDLTDKLFLYASADLGTLRLDLLIEAEGG